MDFVVSDQFLLHVPIVVSHPFRKTEKYSDQWALYEAPEPTHYFLSVPPTSVAVITKQDCTALPLHASMTSV